MPFVAMSPLFLSRGTINTAVRVTRLRDDVMAMQYEYRIDNQKVHAPSTAALLFTKYPYPY